MTSREPLVANGPRRLCCAKGARLIALVAAIGLIGTLGCKSFTNAMLLHPTSRPIRTDATRLEFTGQSDPIAGQTVEAFYKEYGAGAAEPELYVLALTGNAGRAESMQLNSAALFETWLETGAAPERIGVLSLQYPGYGVATEGDASLESMGAAAVEAVAFLRARAQTRPIILQALSMGTVAALHCARVCEGAEIQGLILAKPPNLGPMLMGEYGWWNLWLISYPMVLQLPDCALSSENAAAVSGMPALFLIAEADTLVPPEYAGQVYDAFGGPKRRIALPGGHNTTVWSKTCPELDEGLDWLWRELDPSGAGSH